MNSIHHSSKAKFPIKKIVENVAVDFEDMLSIEEPMEIRMVYGNAENRVTKKISVTMRTPGNDEDLALGFLFTENIISNFEDVKSVFSTSEGFGKENIVTVEVEENTFPNFGNVDRNFYTTSSCGVCGKSSIESIKQASTFENSIRPELKFSKEIFYHLPKILKKYQENFISTGGIHASGLFSLDGELIVIREDVGRHNALDKLIGASLQKKNLPLNQHILLLSGRASFELIQKAYMAGISVIAAIGAPSSLAVEMGIEKDITLIGFLKENRFNVYHQSKNIQF